MYTHTSENTFFFSELPALYFGVIDSQSADIDKDPALGTIKDY